MSAAIMAAAAMGSSSARRIYGGLGAALGWFALALQYGLGPGGALGGASLAGTVNFFSYFTILSNLLAALALSAAAFGRGRGVLTRPVPATAIALYVTVTALIYVLVLRQIWDPQGWLRVADTLLHYVMPAVFIVYWLLFVPKAALRPGDCGFFLIFPALYAGYTLIHGALSGFYPYPFVDVVRLGYPRVAVNMIGLTAAFAALGWLYCLAARRLSRGRRRRF